MKAIIAVAVAAALVGAYFMTHNSKPEPTPEDLFIDYVAEYRKSYFSKDEYNMRLGVFAANLKKIESMNANPNDEAVYGINHLSDWTEEEFTKLLGFRAGPEQVDEVAFNPLGQDKDWRSSKDMTPVKDQASCGSCWAFAAAETIESAFAATHGHDLYDLSEQELVDCSRSYGNHGCSGGWQYYAFKYAEDNKGLNTESEYPYHAKDETCKKVTTKRHAPILSHFKVKNTQSSLEGAIDQAPIAVAVDASNWSQYRSGDFSNCGSRVNHAVVAVGHTDSHWIVRNSWGARWGEKGFIYLKKGNTCNILNYAYGVKAV